ncbi:MAG: carbamoyltransferase HypF, partial [Geobacter sp.]|nr:carbamoyltransferase HypF [Geobacter sp.]
MLPVKRYSITIRGIVQGVGFRPFVYRLAAAAGLSGWVRNGSDGVTIEAQGGGQELAAFLVSLQHDAPPLALINSLQTVEIPPAADSDFRIISSSSEPGSAPVPPDCDVCPDCLRELFNPVDRRYRYPFINCTNCGPRYSIITATPYDRPNTTMAMFSLCPECEREYNDPLDRRFHAQPVACPACGPALTIRDALGNVLAGDPLEIAVAALKNGKIVAVKGVGGYHLAVDPTNSGAVMELRRRKRRDEKPFALLAASLEAAALLAKITPLEERFLASVERPILLLPKLDGQSIAPEVAPANGYLGIMLPSNPLQHLLMQGNFAALVMTSANVSEEPVIYRDDEALRQLSGIADMFLSHNRPIHEPSDDSVIRVLRTNTLLMRRSRGYVPRAIRIPAIDRPVFAAGGELKAAICLAAGDQACPGRHIGDLKSAATLAEYGNSFASLQRLTGIAPEMAAVDLHPDYYSTRFAEELALPLVAVQHHHAHLAACMAENLLEGEVIGVIFDGTGLGDDGTIWG